MPGHSLSTEQFNKFETPDMEFDIPSPGGAENFGSKRFSTISTRSASKPGFPAPGGTRTRGSFLNLDEN